MAEPSRNHRKRNNLIKTGLVWLLLAGGLAALIWAFLPKPLRVEQGRVERASLSIRVREDGKTRVNERYLVSSPLLASFARSDLEAGDSVTPTTIVARLLPLAPPLLDARTRASANERVAAAAAAERQAHATIERVRTAYQFAEREVARLQALEKQTAASSRSVDQATSEAATLKQDLASSEFAAKVADHELALARAALGLYGRVDAQSEPMLVGSPIEGRVLRTFQESEGVVQPGTPLIEIGNPAALEIVSLVLTSDAVNITPGTRAIIDHWGGDTTLRAHVRMVEPSAITRLSALGVEEQRVNVVLDIDSARDEWKALGDGYRVEVSFLLWEGDDLLVAPASAVFRREDGHALFRIDDEGRARLTTVRIGRSNDDNVEISSGVPMGTRVIVHPSDRVHDGAKVQTP